MKTYTSMTDQESSDMLALRTEDHPFVPGAALMVFATWEQAVQHLCDHLLSAPECHGWVILVPRVREIVAPDADRARLRYCQNAWETQGRSSQALYDLYAQEIIRTLQDARQLQWHCPSGGAVIAFGTSGVLVVVEHQQGTQHVVKTAFLPGFGNPGTVVKSRDANGREVGLRRESQAAGPALSRRKRCARDERAHERRMARWTGEERLYYMVFRVALRTIRSWHYVRCPGRTSNRLGDYARLKDVLPPRSALKFDQWQALRRDCR